MVYVSCVQAMACHAPACDEFSSRASIQLYQPSPPRTSHASLQQCQWRDSRADFADVGRLRVERVGDVVFSYGSIMFYPSIVLVQLCKQHIYIYIYIFIYIYISRDYTRKA